MKKNLLDIISGHEQEDRQKLYDRLSATLINDYENAGIYLNAIRLNNYDLIPDAYSCASPNLLIRKADKFSIRKHTGAGSILRYFHSHSFFELIYVHSGKCDQYLADGEEPVIIKEGQLCLLTPGAVHALEPAKPDDLVFKIYIPLNMFENILHDLKKELPAATEKIAENGSIHYFNSESGLIVLLLMKLIEESVFAQEGRDAAIKSFLTLIFLNLLREADDETDSCLRKRAKKYIESDFRAANLKDFSLLLGYSDGHVSRLLKEKLNHNFSQILQILKIEQAEKLLLETDMSIESVASELGYSNASGMYKQFWKVYGMTPGNFRKRKQI